jgi:hypothetical protein
MLMRYEDFVHAPKTVFADLAGRLGLDAGGGPFTGEHTAVLGDNHTVWGNPDRLRSGAIEIRADNDWYQQQPTSDYLRVTGLSAPGLIRFGYRLTRRSAVPA